MKRLRTASQLVPEDRRIIQGLTVEENLKLAQIAPPIGWSLDRLYELFPRLGEGALRTARPCRAANNRCWPSRGLWPGTSRCFLLDEPYEGLAPVIVQEIAKTLNIIRDQGITTIIVEQNAVAALRLADRAVILDTGQVVYDDSAQKVLEDEALRAKYLAI